MNSRFKVFSFAAMPELICVSEYLYTHGLSWLLTPATSARARQSENQQVRETLSGIEFDLLQTFCSESARNDDQKSLEGILNAQQQLAWYVTLPDPATLEK